MQQELKSFNNKLPLCKSRKVCSQGSRLEDRVKFMQISQYEIIKEIHYGNLAESYIAMNSDGERVYLKRLILEKAQEELRLRFPLEIQALQDLKGHANVCSILDTGEDSDGNPFFVTEFVDGFNLEERLSDPDRRFSLENVRQIILSILSVLDYSHNRTQSYIHRDINNTFAKMGDGAERLNPV
jgi:serine/threonine protein kinase